MGRLLRLCFFPLLLLLCISVSAAQIASREIDVNAQFRTVANTPASYSVDIQWTDMTFTYTKEDTHIWNPKTHAYKTRSRTGWDRNKGTVTVTNHSNVDVKVTVSYIPLEETGVTGTLRNATKKLKAGKVGDYGGADSMTATLTIGGTPAAAVAGSKTKVGSLTISIQ